MEGRRWPLPLLKFTLPHWVYDDEREADEFGMDNSHNVTPEVEEKANVCLQLASDMWRWQDVTRRALVSSSRVTTIYRLEGFTP